MLNALKYGYKVTKPRIMTENMRSLKTYREDLKKARKNIHMEATQYQNQIEDQFLERHKKIMKQKHFRNQCKFRGLVAKQSYILFKQLQELKEQHEHNMQRLQKYVHQEEIKKMNRNRIKKILEYQSSNYWLTPNQLKSRLINQNMVPSVIGTTQYYHKLYAQALAYQQLDLDMVEKISNSQQLVAQKNKSLIPIYKQVVILIRELKTNQYQKLKDDYQVKKKQYDVIYNSDANLKTQKLNQLSKQYEQKLDNLLKQYNSETMSRSFLVSRLKIWVSLLMKWAEYTQVLNLTSVQVRQKMEEQILENSVQIEKKKIKKQLVKNKESKFVDPVEEDTQDDSITLEQFIKKNTDNSDKLFKAGLGQSNQQNLQLQMLLKQQQSIFDEVSQQVNQQQKQMKKQTKISRQIIRESEQLRKQEALQELQQQINIDERLLSFGETTTSIQLLKKQYQNDPEVIKLLNITGEIMIDYPQLFKKVWDEQIV